MGPRLRLRGGSLGGWLFDCGEDLLTTQGGYMAPRGFTQQVVFWLEMSGFPSWWGRVVVVNPE